MKANKYPIESKATEIINQTKDLNIHTFNYDNRVYHFKTA